ncbi:actin depolymerizing protein [Chloropicon primus]|uniref:Actin depolymerizing protein n=1 Tax=Chloropicon primus TaxID=1764295 RepID=A0A5B8MFW8_9CHLO|nr:actin depolymerizing protein [Chloropicon primus]UPQ98303.1 actin depolymerizing protein [Chloropicon primus]|eukprot:QDZ19094.1 actin depolymerizing protein [Chloropicon primus]
MLESCMEALKKGLITQDDYDTAKKTFLRCQQLSVGLQVGMVAKSELEGIKEDFRKAIGQPLSAGGVVEPFPTSGDEKDAPAEEEEDELKDLPLKPSPRVTSRPVSVSAPPKPTPESLKSPSSASNEDVGGVFKAREGAKSISGIRVAQNVVDAFEDMKHKKKYRYLVYEINLAAGLVVLQTTGARDAEYDEFTESLPDADCRYCIYDYDYTNDDGCKFNKFVFVMWSPDISTIKTKMLYASTKEYLRDCLDGIGIELQATDISEIDADSMYDRVRAVMTRK